MHRQSRLIAIVVSMAFMPLITAAQAPSSGAPPPGAPPGGMPPPGAMPGGPGMPPGGPPGMPAGPPARADIYIENGAETAAREYAAGKFRAMVKSDGAGLAIDGLALSSGDYAHNGIVVTGAKSELHLRNARVHLGVTHTAGAKEAGGAALSVHGGATVTVDHSDLTVDGAQRYVTETGDTSTLVVNDSRVTQTGSNPFTRAMTEPFSNDALLISGIARANMSVNASRTYYYNSVVTTEGWAALSTDAAAPAGLDLYAYNTRAVAQHGGYGTYADFSCRVWLYGSTLESAEIGAIIAKSGHITIADGASVPAEVLRRNAGAKTSAGSVVTGGRNAVMVHAPDMMGGGRAAADAGTLDVIRSTLVTDRRLKGTRDYATHISPATAAYIDYVAGADLLIKSTSGNFNFDGATLQSFSNVLVMSVLNSDKWGNFLKNESDGAAVKPIAVSFRNMKASGDIRHMDYQRLMTLTLENATLEGAIVSGGVADWNRLWSRFPRKDTVWVQNDSWKTVYGVQLALKKGATWRVTGASQLSALRIDTGAVLEGRLLLDGKPVQAEAGRSYAGQITVTPLQARSGL